MTLSSWYFGSESIYFDLFYTDSILQRFKIVIKPDLSDISLHVIYTFETVSYDLIKSFDSSRVCDGYQICEDALVYYWNNIWSWGAYAGSLTSAPSFTSGVTLWKRNLNAYVKSLCPTSGTFVYCTSDRSYISDKIIVDDFKSF